MRFFFLILFAFLLLQINAQDWKTPSSKKNEWEMDIPSELDKQKRSILLISEASAYTIALVGLNQLWYADYPKSTFHFINDNGEWLQMDKLGHMSSSYYTGVAGIKAYEWAGFSRKKAIWYGGMTGSLFLTIIEVLDGQSAEWGASSGDLIANTTGSLLVIAQALKWNEQRIQLKYSYYPTKFAEKNPKQLGGSHLERALKDYNGQTYWMSFNLKSLMQIENEDFPNWLSLALGYSATGMETPFAQDNNSDRERQFLLSLDVDLNKIKTKNKALNAVLHTFGFLKFPAPAMQYTNGNISFYPIYY
jgi:uncharacterized protein YfiM (DUF2279 family)